MQFSANLTHVPLRIPISFCLPKECNNSQYFNPLTEQLDSRVHKLLVFVKEHVNIENVYYDLPKGNSSSNKLAHQAVMLANNQTELTISAIVRKEDQ